MLLPAGNDDPGDLYVLGGGPIDREERRLDTETLFDRLGEQRSVGCHGVELVGVGE